MKNLIVLMVLLLTQWAKAQEPQGLAIGNRAPNFKGTDQNGTQFQLKEALKDSAVLIVFYRGQWCPYCNRQLKHLQDSLPILAKRKIRVVAVSPETGTAVQQTVQKTGAQFTLIPDDGGKIMKAFDVAFTVDDATVNRYKSFKINLLENNGANGNTLPVPAVYLIGSDGFIRYAWFNKDYKVRPSVKSILESQ